MAVNTTLQRFGEDLAKILGEYSEEVDKAIMGGLDEAAECYRKEVADVASREAYDPEGKDPHYKDSWVIKDAKPKFHRYVGNTKMVKGKNGMIPLINILEYGRRKKDGGNERESHRPVIKKAINNSKGRIREIFVNQLNKGE
jgi:hypothetical protein